MTFITAIAAKGHLPLANWNVCLALHLLCDFLATIPLPLSFGTSETVKGQEGFRARPGARSVPTVLKHKEA